MRPFPGEIIFCSFFEQLFGRDYFVDGYSLSTSRPLGVAKPRPLRVPNDGCPIPKAGPNQTVPVILDGSASSDPNGGPLNYGWRQTGGPSVSFSPALSVTTFTVPATPAVLSFSLTITTSEGYTATESTIVTVTQVSSYTLTVTTVGSGTSVSTRRAASTPKTQRSPRLPSRIAVGSSLAGGTI